MYSPAWFKWMRRRRRYYTTVGEEKILKRKPKIKNHDTKLENDLVVLRIKWYGKIEKLIGKCLEVEIFCVGCL